jgi:hypothetical protein
VGAGGWIGLLAENARKENQKKNSANVFTKPVNTSAVKHFVTIAAATAK